MKNGTQSNGSLRLVDSTGESVGSDARATSRIGELKMSLSDGSNGPGAEQAEDSPCGNPMTEILQNKVVFGVVSIACLTAAVAAGSYAIWLSRRKVADEALTHVGDLLKTCQSHMSQMERDLKSMSQVQSASGA